MEFITEYWFFILLVLVLLAYKINSPYKNEKKKKDKTNELINRADYKPSNGYLSQFLAGNIFELYQRAKTKLEKIGKTDFVFLGSERGWCLKLTDSDKSTGIISLIRKKLDAYFFPSLNQFYGISSDIRIEKNLFRSYFQHDKVMLSRHERNNYGPTEIHIEINTILELDNFIDIVKLMKYYE